MWEGTAGQGFYVVVLGLAVEGAARVGKAGPGGGRRRKARLIFFFLSD